MHMSENSIMTHGLGIIRCDRDIINRILITYKMLLIKYIKEIL
jgi:hypothetical protein